MLKYFIEIITFMNALWFFWIEFDEMFIIFTHFVLDLMNRFYSLQWEKKQL